MVSRELNVRQVLAKVVLGEADAGIVYRTDAATAAGKVEVVDIDPGVNVIAEYPVARGDRRQAAGAGPGVDRAVALARGAAPAGAGGLPGRPGAVSAQAPAAAPR